MIAKIVTKVVDIEGPIHVDELALRTARIWGHVRTGDKIRAAVESGIEIAVELGNVSSCDTDAVYFQPLDGTVHVRNRSDLHPSTRRRLSKRIPPSECREAILATLRHRKSFRQDQIAYAVSHLLGLSGDNEQLFELVEAECLKLVEDQQLVVERNRLKLPPRPSRQR